jgi:hypothetical protein
MKTLAQLIAEWLSGWKECIKCNMMCNTGNIVCTEDECNICLDCLHNNHWEDTN